MKTVPGGGRGGGGGGYCVYFFLPITPVTIRRRTSWATWKQLVGCLSLFCCWIYLTAEAADGVVVVIPYSYTEDPGSIPGYCICAGDVPGETVIRQSEAGSSLQYIKINWRPRMSLFATFFGSLPENKMDCENHFCSRNNLDMRKSVLSPYEPVTTQLLKGPFFREQNRFSQSRWEILFEQKMFNSFAASAF